MPTRSLSLPVSGLSFPERELAFPGREVKFPTGLVQTEQAGAVEVNLPADVLFDFDKAELRADARETLRELGALLMERPRRSIVITGHADALGSDAYNQRLSERRAVAVKTWLVSREGVKTPPISTSGRGARDPVAPNRKADGTDDPEGRQLNRRVTIVFRN
jgi:outer membrane protein OmpA-like peptidoglycan-associated protein